MSAHHSQTRCLTPAVERVMAWHRQKLPSTLPMPEDEDLQRAGADDAALRKEEGKESEEDLLDDSSASSAAQR
jgi:hypothetical protein